MQPRVLVIALAEATFDLIQPFVKAGKMPNVSRMMTGGAWGRLQSQMPMVTPQMCGTVVTGRSPGQHGLMDFYQRGNDGRFREANGNDWKVPPVWRILSQQGLKCAVLNIPFTYPPDKINGFVISGEDAPGTHTSIAHPRGLYEEIIKEFGRYPLKDTFPGGRQKSDYLTLITADVKRQGEIFSHLLKNKEWDFGIMFFSQTAMVQHYFWADHESRDPANPFRTVIESAYVALDAAIGKLQEAAGPNTTVFVISDAGAGPMKSGVNVNQFLEQEGFLHRSRKSQAADEADEPSEHKVSFLEQVRHTAQGILQRDAFRWLYYAVNRYLQPLKVWMQTRLSNSDIDWSRTQAYSRGQWGYIYVNLKGRDPHGIVNPGAQYDEVCKRISASFEKLIDPQTGQKAATRVWRRDELYHGPGVEFAPDMVIDWVDGAYMPNEASRSDSVFSTRQREYMDWPTTGSHRLDGVLVAAGPAIAAGTTVQGARIVDLVPTWLSLLGQNAPKELEGKVIQSLFQERLAS